MQFVSTLRTLALDDRGDVLVEYALILAVLALGSLTALLFSGTAATNAMDTTTSTQLRVEQTTP
jgi:Flp pilus assembly pilin Flp